MVPIEELLHLVVDQGASDLHLDVALSPVIRVDGELKIQTQYPSLKSTDIGDVFDQVTSPDQRQSFLGEKELDFAYSVNGLARFRVNIMRQRGSLSMTFRQVPFQIPSIEKLGVPDICRDLILKPRGLVLLCGATGSGKSTTMASMLDYLNQNASRYVITIEDPIEYLHNNKKCIISQRDLGDDTQSFATALKYALRHDPDVIIVGEMRDLETISTAMTAAETGNLVVSTLHAADAAQAVDRIIDVFRQTSSNKFGSSFHRYWKLCWYKFCCRGKRKGTHTSL